jgi:hypothetical protein
MQVEFGASASKHGISHDRARFVVATCPSPIYPPDPDPGEEDLVVFLGPDARGVPLEVAAIELENGDLLVIHAMRMRQKDAAEYARVMSCR